MSPLNYELDTKVYSDEREFLGISGRVWKPKTIHADFQGCQTVRQCSDVFYRDFASEFFQFDFSTPSLNHWTIMVQEYAEETPEGVWLVITEWEQLLNNTKRKGLDWAALTALTGIEDNDLFLFVTMVASRDALTLVEQRIREIEAKR